MAPVDNAARGSDRAKLRGSRCAQYKGPPPEISSDVFYETEPTHGFSIQTVGPLPIAWAEHVIADGDWATRCASACATTTTGPRSACSASCSRSWRTA